MILIAHRGNTCGPSKDENRQSHIENAILQGYEAEIDVWYSKGALYLGHDGPEYSVSPLWLNRYASVLWIHAKSLDTLYHLLANNPALNCFVHDQDPGALTSRGFIWSFPQHATTHRSISVMPSSVADVLSSGKCAGVCADDFTGVYQGGAT